MNRSWFRADYLRRRVDTSQLTLNRSYVSFSKSPLAAFLEGRNNIAPRKFVDSIRAQVE
jgi:hypothetical protein